MKNKNESGVLSIEATICLTMLIFIVMFVLDVAYVCRAQNMVYHGMLQATKSAALYNYEVESETTAKAAVAKLMKAFGWDEGVTRLQLRDAFKSGDASKVAEITFKGSISEEHDDAKDVLKKYKVRKISFANSVIDSTAGTITIVADYEIDLIAPAFGIETIKITQSTKSKLWKRPS